MSRLSRTATIWTQRIPLFGSNVSTVWVFSEAVFKFTHLLDIVMTWPEKVETNHCFARNFRLEMPNPVTLSDIRIPRLIFTFIKSRVQTMTRIQQSCDVTIRNYATTNNVMLDYSDSFTEQCVSSIYSADISVLSPVWRYNLSRSVLCFHSTSLFYLIVHGKCRGFF
jgi:hypothetical protein